MIIQIVEIHETSYIYGYTWVKFWYWLDPPVHLQTSLLIWSTLRTAWWSLLSPTPLVLSMNRTECGTLHGSLVESWRHQHFFHLLIWEFHWNIVQFSHIIFIVVMVDICFLYISTKFQEIYQIWNSRIFFRIFCNFSLFFRTYLDFLRNIG